MAAYDLNSQLGQQLSTLIGSLIQAQQTAQRLVGDFASRETNGGATDADYDAIKVEMSLSSDTVARGLVSLVGTINTNLLNDVLGLGGFDTWDPEA